jgi:hypothetical protein
MISAVITRLGDERRLAASLAGLAPAAIDGLVREALVVDVGADEAVLEAADDAGARVIGAAGEAEGLAAACAAARGPWLLILPCGVRLQTGWEASARRHIERCADRAGWFTLALDAEGVGARLAEALAAIRAGWFGRPAAGQGLLISKRLFDRRVGQARAIDHAGLIRRLGSGALRGLGARALN